MLSIANAPIDRKAKTELNAIGQMRVQPVPPEPARRRGAEEIGQDAPRMTSTGPARVARSPPQLQFWLHSGDMVRRQFEPPTFAVCLRPAVRGVILLALSLSRIPTPILDASAYPAASDESNAFILPRKAMEHRTGHIPGTSAKRDLLQGAAANPARRTLTNRQ
ncbi:uncharacterized protein G6M90_00g001520 [Metarhizium brunneum]|uniref:Uncharacterized protein n=1 Tax=Metarhizium brunneum TaxID=500148 RepID=A0A7D5UTK4_9HYPO|nr:hypothetical protein G6M90_00g001520 [Metarhizium brunneum]